MRERERGEIDWKRGAGMVVCVVAALLVFWLLFRYVLGVVLPFLLAYLLSRLIKPLVDRICRRGKIPRSLVAGLLVVLFTGGVCVLAVMGIGRGLSEAERLISELTQDEEGVMAAIGSLAERAGSVSEHIPFLKRFENTPGYADFCAWLDGAVQGALDRWLGSVGEALPDAAMALAGWLPGAFVFVTVLFLSCYYFSADNGKIAGGVNARLEAWFPPAWQDNIRTSARRLRRMGRQYARAYFILGFFTFLEAFIGLSILGVRYAFLLSWVIALVDFLPLLGTGVVLVPWGVICLLMGNFKLGIGLLVLYVVCTLLRQVMEPRFIGRELGLHPLASLLTMYVGLRFFGVAGMLMVPILTAAFVSLLPARCS